MKREHWEQENARRKAGKRVHLQFGGRANRPRTKVRAQQRAQIHHHWGEVGTGHEVFKFEIVE